MLTAALFPTPYDWRCRVISNLASPRDNPQWYGLGSADLILTGACRYLFLAVAVLSPQRQPETADEKA